MYAYIKFMDGTTGIAPTENIKKFDHKNFQRNKIYKILWEDGAYYEGLVLLLDESEEKVKQKYNSSRIKYPSRKVCISADESSTQEEKSNSDDNKSTPTSSETCNNFATILEKKLNSASNNLMSLAPLSGSDNEVNINKSSSKKSEFQNEKENDNSRKSKNIEIDDETTPKQSKKNVLKKENKKLKITIAEQNATIKELQSRNEALQIRVINSMSEIKDFINKFQDINNQPADVRNNNFNVDIPSVGQRCAKNNTIHTGHNVWLPCQIYDSIVSISKRPPQFVKNAAKAIFGTPTLKNSTVTGKVSNRFRRVHPEKAARPALDGTKFLSLKSLFKYWMETKNYDEATIDFQLSQTGLYVDQQINELNRECRKRNNDGEIIEVVNNRNEQNVIFVEEPVININDIDLNNIDFDIDGVVVTNNEKENMTP